MTTKLPPTSPSSKPTEPAPSIPARALPDSRYLISTVTKAKPHGTTCLRWPENSSSAPDLSAFAEPQFDPPEEWESIYFLSGTPIRTHFLFERLCKTFSLSAATRWEQEGSSRKR